MSKSLFLLILLYIFTIGVCRADESEIFSSPVPPDALLILDLSGGMNDDPAGNACSTPGCTKIEIAKEAIFNILDSNKDGEINADDEDRLKVRIGYMKLSGQPAPGTVTLVKEIGSSYADTWNSVSREVAVGGDPLASGLSAAKLYLDSHKATDPAKDCRIKFVILLSDGMDTYACNGDGTLSQPDQHQRRKATLAKAKALADAGYKLFVIGFGANTPADLKNTLNWTAYYGGTDSPAASNSGDVRAVIPSVDPCNEELQTNDPGSYPLDGYIYLAANTSELTAVLKQMSSIIRQSRYSFAGFAVASTRTRQDNFLYETSFQPVEQEPFWPGYLRKYQINPDGSIGPVVWDAGAKLQAQKAEGRNIFTLTALIPFNRENITKEALGVETDAERDSIVSYIRGESPANPDNWKLGDIFHSNPMSVGAPSAYFEDFRSPPGFADFRNLNKSRERMIFAGANDGQFHTFTDGGDEKWSFIPPNLLPKLKYLAHAHPITDDAKKIHRYFVDGPVTAADVWLGAGDGFRKSAGEWQTLLVFGEGPGVRDLYNLPAYLWSASPSCDRDFYKKYDSSHPYYCGYYAFNISQTGASLPEFKWLIKPRITDAPYLDEPWSRMAIGRILIDGQETWVGFIGGGYTTQEAYEDDDEDSKGRRGKGFFVVRLKDGTILWSYTKRENDQMDYNLPASPTAVDTDSDGFIDTVYLGDLGGNMWRFKFCTRKEDEDAVANGGHCGMPNWKGGLLFKSSAGFVRPIFTTAAVARGSIWIFWGTGDKQNPASIPKDSGVHDKFVALKDDDRGSIYNIDSLENITDAGVDGRVLYVGARPGWYIDLMGGGEKVISNPTVFGGMVLFATYTPAPPGNDPCLQAGTATFYALAMMPIKINGIMYNPGAGVLSDPTDRTSTKGGNRSLPLGMGIPSVPIISQKLGDDGFADFYISVSGGGGTDTKVVSPDKTSSPLGNRLKDTPPRSQVIHWKDRRLR